MRSPDAAPFRWDRHQLLVHRSEHERRTEVYRWVRSGLDLGAKIVYFEPPDEHPSRSLAGILAAHGLPFDHVAERGQIEIRSPGPEDYSPAGQRRILQEARVEGYRYVGVSAEVRAASTVVAQHTHTEAERSIDSLCHVEPLSALCQYPADLPHPHRLKVFSLHRDGVTASRLHTDSRPGELAVAGQVDLSNAEALHAALRAATRTLTLPTLHVDLSALGFLDVRGARALLSGTDAYRRSGGVVRLRGAHGTVKRVLTVLETEKEPGVEIAVG